MTYALNRETPSDQDYRCSSISVFTIGDRGSIEPPSVSSPTGQLLNYSDQVFFVLSPTTQPLRSGDISPVPHHTSLRTRDFHPVPWRRRLREAAAVRVWVKPPSVMELMFAEWEDGERFSFEDSDRFEEDSLCSFISEAESLCQNWRGWRKQSAGPNSPTVKVKGDSWLLFSC